MFIEHSFGPEMDLMDAFRGRGFNIVMGGAYVIISNPYNGKEVKIHLYCQYGGMKVEYDDESTHLDSTREVIEYVDSVLEN